MNTHGKQNSPAVFGFLSGIGVVVILVGLVDLFGSGDLVTKSLQFPGYELIMVLLGVAMMLPSILYSFIPEQRYEIPKKTKHRRHQDVFENSR